MKGQRDRQRRDRYIYTPGSSLMLKMDVGAEQRALLAWFWRNFGWSGAREHTHKVQTHTQRETVLRQS